VLSLRWVSYILLPACWRVWHLHSFTGRNPGILEANRQTRTEALGLFYSENTFVVDDAEYFVIKDWLFEGVGLENMKSVRCSSGTW
jgi:hypothetical protein